MSISKITTESIATGVSLSGNTVLDNLVVTGDLTVSGNTTTLNVETLTIEDKNIVLANVAIPSNVTADGAGITVLGATNKSFNWVSANNAWESSENVNLVSGKEYKIGNTSVLSSTGLGSGVLSSSLTSVGTLSSLNVSGNTTIGDAAGDTLTINAGTTTFTQGTASGVLYLNGSKVATSGSGLVFDGANLGVGVSPTSRLQVAGAIAAGNDGSAVSYYYTGGMAIRGSSAGALYIDTAVSGGTDIIFRPAVSETARITSKGLLVGYTSDASLSSTGNAIFSGNVGIGTSSPGVKLEVSGSTVSARVTGTSGTAAFFQTTSSGVQDWSFGTRTTGKFVINAGNLLGGSDVLTLDSSGNLGLGVTPSGWTSSNSATLQFKNVAVSGINWYDLHLSSNAYYTGSSWQYIAGSVVASNYYQNAGAHIWRTTGTTTGSADATISWSNVMTLSASGILSANDIRSPIFYDSNDTSYYINPNGSSVFHRLYVAGYGVRSSQALDLRSLDQSTYYPVTITGLAYARPTRLRVFQQLDGNSVPSWSTHPGGFSLRCDWVTNGSGWGTISLERTINSFTYQYANVNPVGGIVQNVFSSYEVIYLRGGGYYYFESDADATATIRTSSFTSDGYTVAPTTSVVNDVWTSASNKFGVYSLYSGALGTGAVYSNVGVLTSTNPSDQRLKDDISSVNWGLNELLQFSPKSFVWKEDRANQGKQYGWIAQEVLEIIPELIKEFDTDQGIRYGLDKDGIIVIMHNAIKELSMEIELLKQKTNNL